MRFLARWRQSAYSFSFVNKISGLFSKNLGYVYGERRFGDVGLIRWMYTDDYGRVCFTNPSRVSISPAMLVELSARSWGHGDGAMDTEIVSSGHWENEQTQRVPQSPAGPDASINSERAAHKTHQMWNIQSLKISLWTAFLTFFRAFKDPKSSLHIFQMRKNHLGFELWAKKK